MRIDRLFNICTERPARRRTFARSQTGSDQSGFTLVEVTTSIGLLTVVLAAAWMLLTVSSENLNRIEYGGQSAELNRSALAWFERDLNHGVLPADEVSPILEALPTQCAMLVAPSGTTERQLITWKADTSNDTLLRVVTASTPTTTLPTTVGDFVGGESTTTVVLSGLDWGGINGPGIFVYQPDAVGTWNNDPRTVGLVTFHLRNGLPDPNSNVTDRTAAFRVMALVINGY